MSPEELENLRKVFDMCDTDHDGFLVAEELCEWMKRMGRPMTKAALLRILKNCDWNNDGRLDFNEFVALTQSLDNEEPGETGHSDTCGDREEIDPKADMKEAFKVFDKDGNGLISPLELRETLSGLGLLSSSRSLSRIHSMISKVDSDGDGHVSFTEFEAMMMGK
ncbi:hypothetical protein KP509_04G048400 [Ceratopteris richardii]|nr:hypothetical protein KP509_04G048400 [Ceratopteris richardii]